VSIALALLALAGCAAPAPTPVPAVDVADRLLVALREAEFDRAYELLATGDGRSFAPDPDVLRTRIEEAGGPPVDYTLESPRVEQREQGDVTVIEGTLEFDSGTSRRFVLELMAGGTSGPWRIASFSIR
jgi:hypothetical protein